MPLVSRSRCADRPDDYGIRGRFASARLVRSQSGVRRRRIHQTDTVAADSDESLRAALASIGHRPGSLLGQGGEACVYALGQETVIRVLHRGGDAASLKQRRLLVDELNTPRGQYELPDILEIGEVAGRVFAIERRLPGSSLIHQLARLDGSDRDLLVENHLDASASLAKLPLERRGWFGDLLAEPPIRGATWREFLEQRAKASLDRSTGSLRGIDAGELAEALPEPSTPAFVHLDAFAGNMLAVGTNVTAILDIGGKSAVAGDGRMNPLATAVYISSPQITPGATRRDARVASAWLEARGLTDYFEPARRWLAAYWSHAVDDARLLDWCVSTLRAG